MALSISLTGCKGQNHKRLNNNLEKVYMDKNSNGKELLIKHSFKFPDKTLFCNRMQEVFGYDVEMRKGIEVDTISAISLNDESNFISLEIFIKDKYVGLTLVDKEDMDKTKYKECLYSFNNYIFYGNKNAFAGLIPYGDYITDLVQFFGYWDVNIKKFIINDMIKKRSDEHFPELFFSTFFGRKGINGAWKLRRYVLDAYLDALPTTYKYGPNELIMSKAYWVEEPFDTYVHKYLFEKPYKSMYGGNLEEDVAYMIEKIYTKAELCDYIEMNTMGTIGNIYDKYPYLLEHYKKKNFYGYEKLKIYTDLYEEMKECD